MTHPEELLAGYVDGTSSPQDRAVVDAHLTACQRCRQEVADARAGLAALTRLPEASAPADLGARALAEAGADAGRPPATVRHLPTAPRWQRWAGPAAAAAAILLVVTLVLPKIGGGGTSSADRAGASSAGIETTTGAAVPMEISSANYVGDQLLDLATDSAAKMGGAANAAPEFSSGSASAEQVRTAAPAAAAKATACIQQAFVQTPGTLVRLIQARYEGQPAYIGFYAEGPGGGQPADALTVRVASAGGCSILTSAQVPA